MAGWTSARSETNSGNENGVKKNSTGSSSAAAHGAKQTSAVMGQRFDFAVKPSKAHIVRMVFHCPAIAGKRSDIIRSQEYKIKLSMTYQKGRIVVVADAVQPSQHPAAGSPGSPRGGI